MNNLLDFDDYILEANEIELQEEILNEGLKDWLKKAALTTAVATCCLNLAAAPKEKVDELPQEKDKIENVQNINTTKQFTSSIEQNEDGSFTLISKPSKSESMATTLGQKLELAISKDYKNMKIKKIKKLYNQQTGQYAYAIILISEN